MFGIALGPGNHSAKGVMRRYTVSQVQKSTQPSLLVGAKRFDICPGFRASYDSAEGNRDDVNERIIVQESTPRVLQISKVRGNRRWFLCFWCGLILFPVFGRRISQVAYLAKLNMRLPWA